MQIHLYGHRVLINNHRLHSGVIIVIIIIIIIIIIQTCILFVILVHNFVCWYVIEEMERVITLLVTKVLDAVGPLGSIMSEDGDTLSLY